MKKYISPGFMPHRTQTSSSNLQDRLALYASGNLSGDGGGATGGDPKPRLRWTPELHERFVDAVMQLGGPDSKLPLSVSICVSSPTIHFCFTSAIYSCVTHVLWCRSTWVHMSAHEATWGHMRALEIWLSLFFPHQFFWFVCLQRRHQKQWWG